MTDLEQKQKIAEILVCWLGKRDDNKYHYIAHEIAGLFDENEIAKRKIEEFLDEWEIEHEQTMPPISEVLDWLDKESEG